MDESVAQMTSQAAALPTSSDTPKSNVLPWGKTSLSASSFVFGLGAGFLLIWQNFKRMGREEDAKKFFWKGIGINVGVTAILVFMIIMAGEEQGRQIAKASQGLGLFYPWLFGAKELKEWEQQHASKGKFSWSILGWGFLGLIFQLVLAMTVFFVMGILGVAG